MAGMAVVEGLFLALASSPLAIAYAEKSAIGLGRVYFCEVDIGAGKDRSYT